MHQLRVFTFIVQHGSMTAAASALGISKSVVSGHLKRLEEDLGVRLLERTTRQMALTAVGQEVNEAACRMLHAGEDALIAAESEMGTVGGLLVVACPVDLGPAVLLPAIRLLRAAHPGLRIEAIVGDELVDLISKRVDVAIRLGVPEDSGLFMRRLGRVDEVVLAQPHLAEDWRHAATPEDLVDAPWIVHTAVHGERMRFWNPDSDEVQQVHRKPPALALGSTDLMRVLAAEGHGFILIPELLARHDMKSGRLVRVLAPWIHRRVDLYAVMPSRTRSRRRAAFLDVVARVIGRLSAQET